MKAGLLRLIPPLAYLGLLLAPLPSTSGAAGDLPAIRDAEGRPVPLDVPRGGALAIVFLSAECPIANAESPTIEAIAHAFPAGRFRLVGVFVDPDLTRARLTAHAAEYHLTFPVARDPGLGAGPALQGHRDPRGVRPRRHRSGPLPRSDRRRLRHPDQAERRLQDPRIEGRRRRRPRRPVRRSARGQGCRLPAARAGGGDLGLGDPPPRRGADPPGALPGLPPPGAGRTVLPPDVRPVVQVCPRPRGAGGRPADAPRPGGRTAATPLALVQSCVAPGNSHPPASAACLIGSARTRRAGSMTS